VHDVSIRRCRFSKVEALRSLFLQELNAQCRYDAAHWRKGTRHYLIRGADHAIGYAAVKDTHESGGTVFEFYLIPAFRDGAMAHLREVLDCSGAEALECQSNDVFYTALVRQLSENLTCDTILYAVAQSNGLPSRGAAVRRRRRTDRVFEHTVEPVGDFVVLAGEEVVGTGGFLLHYNRPFADLFMEVRADARRHGYGSFLIQQLITECYLAGRVPAARTGTDNIASQRTLLKGGLRECGRMLRAVVR
jgi:GNAT superfamily N-acetyltransferase